MTDRAIKCLWHILHKRLLVKFSQFFQTHGKYPSSIFLGRWEYSIAEALIKLTAKDIGASIVSSNVIFYKNWQIHQVNMACGIFFQNDADDS